MFVAYLGLGSNMGDRARHLRRAVQMLNAVEGSWVERVSRVYETPPSGGPAGQGLFLNVALRLSTELSPRCLLDQMQAIERKSGRPPEPQRIKWAARSLDLDLLLYGDRVIRDPHLVVPHPLMDERWFVLKPMCDIAADVRHPESGRTMEELLQNLSGSVYDQGHVVEMDLSTCLEPKSL